MSSQGVTEHVAFRQPSKKKRPGQPAHASQHQLYADTRSGQQQNANVRPTGMARFARRFGQFGLASTFPSD